MSLFNRHLHEKDLEVLELYLQGITNKEIAEKVYPDGWVACSPKTAFEKSVRKLEFVLKMPFSKSESIANKEQIYKNLEFYQAHVKRLKEFNKKESELMKESGFKDMR